MTTRVWLLGVAFAGTVGCSGRTIAGDSATSNPDVVNGGATSGNAAGSKASGGGSAGRGNTPSGGSAGVSNIPGAGASSGCSDSYSVCKVVVTIPIVSLPDGTLTTCVDSLCVTQAVTAGQILAPASSDSRDGGSVDLVAALIDDRAGFGCGRG